MTRARTTRMTRPKGEDDENDEGEWEAQYLGSCPGVCHHQSGHTNLLCHYAMLFSFRL